MLALALKKLVHYVNLIRKQDCGFDNFLLRGEGSEFLVRFVNKFTYNPGLLIRDETIPANVGNRYWLAEKSNGIFRVSGRQDP